MNNIVLYCPEIPQNTGNIMRTCMAFDMRLHLIEPLGFYLDEHHLRRAGMDYISEIDYRVYPDYETFEKENHGLFVYFSRYGLKSFDECSFETEEENTYLIFGKESTGIPKEILRDHLDTTYRFPMRAEARSLNLSNCVAIGAYECLRQQGFIGLSKTEVIKGKDWLLK
ncbi:MAG: tRNA (cytidine(34)-2'-O)-methyltransferase [Erysipelotrichaceae bacterium]|nr:tRNA (cytidine(34)-2'-O)-methyltransferase [Erysipelotrichaceae bacterium]